MTSQPGPRPPWPLGKNHVTSLQTFEEALQDSMNRAISHPRHPYTRVSVLLTHWENDDMGVEGVEAELASIFSEIYGYHVEQWVIPTSMSQVKLGEKLFTFRSIWGGEDTLIIIVYSGHAGHSQGLDNPSDKSFYIAGRYNQKEGLSGPKVNWTVLLSGVGVSIGNPGQFLTIMDCCYAGAAVTQDGPEVFAASSSTEIASSDLTMCFTAALVQKLRSLNGAPRNTAELLSEMWRERENYKLEYMPVHISGLRREPATLAGLTSPPVESEEKHKAGKGKAAALAGLTSPPVESEEKQKAGKGKVYLAVGVSENLTQKNLAQFKRWLTSNIPPSIISAEVKVEGVFPSSSSLLLVTIPIEIWTMLPDKPEYQFVSLVDGSNTLLESSFQDTSVLSSLSIRQENIRPGSGGSRK